MTNCIILAKTAFKPSKNSRTVCPFGPMLESIVPKVRLKRTTPKTLMPRFRSSTGS